MSLKTNLNKNNDTIETIETIKIRLGELEDNLIHSDSYDFKSIFEFLKEVNKVNLHYENECDPSNNLLKKVESIKLLVSCELMLKFGSANMLDNSLDAFLLTFNLNDIDEHLGLSFRTRMIKKFINANIKITKKEGDLSNQLFEYINYFFDLMKMINISKYPNSWDISYICFVSFKNQLKFHIWEYLSKIKIKSDEDNILLLSNIKILSNFENKVNLILQNNKSNYQLSTEDSLTNLFENSLNWHLQKIKKSINDFTDTKINEFIENIYVSSNDIANSHKLANSSGISDNSIQSNDSLYDFSLTDNLSTINENPIMVEIILEFKKKIEELNIYSTGNTYFLLIKEVLLQFEKFGFAIQKKYFSEKKKKNQKFGFVLERVLFNLIINIDYCINSINQLLNQIVNNKKIQQKYITVSDFKNTIDFLTKTTQIFFNEWVNETSNTFLNQYDKLSGLKFDEKNINTVEIQFYNYSTTICNKYFFACKKANKILPITSSQTMSEMLTESLIELIIAHILKLRNVNPSTAQFMDTIVTNLFQTTNLLISEKIIDGNKIISSSDIEQLTFKNEISTKITKIKTIINAIAVENNAYNETLHNEIFSQGFIVPYNTMLTIKGSINVQNFHRVTVNVVNDKVSTAVDVTVGSANTVVEGSINIADKFTKLVTGKDTRDTKNDNNLDNNSDNKTSKIFGMSKIQKITGTMSDTISSSTKKVFNGMMININPSNKEMDNSNNNFNKS